MQLNLTDHESKLIIEGLRRLAWERIEDARYKLRTGDSIHAAEPIMDWDLCGKLCERIYAGGDDAPRHRNEPISS